MLRHIILVEHVTETFGGQRDEALLCFRVAACGRLLQRHRTAQTEAELQQAAIFGIQPGCHLRRCRNFIGHRTGQMRRMDDDLARTQPAWIVIEDGDIEVGHLVGGDIAESDAAGQRRLGRAEASISMAGAAALWAVALGWRPQPALLVGRRQAATPNPGIFPRCKFWR